MTATQPLLRCSTCWHACQPGDRFCPRCGAAIFAKRDNLPVDSSTEDERKRLGGTVWQREEQPELDVSQVIELAPLPTSRIRRGRRSRRASRRFVSILLPLTVAVAILMGGIGGRTFSETSSTIDKLQSVSTPPPKIGDATVRDDPEARAGSEQAVSPLTPEEESGSNTSEEQAQSTSQAAGVEPDVSSGEVAQEIPAPDQASAVNDDAPGELQELPGGATDSLPSISVNDPDLDGEAQAEAMLSGGLTFDTAPAVEAIAQHQQEAAGNTPNSPTTSSGQSDEGGGGIFGSLRDKGSQLRDTAEGAAIAVGVTDPQNSPLTILVMGVDARTGSAIDIGVRPDALMILRLDPAAQSCQGLAIPRDSYVELPGYGMTKINHALMLGGIPFQMLVVENYLGIDIDHYALIDFTGFAELVDAVGGVTIDVPAELSSPAVSAGVQTVDGEQALLHARYRGGPDGDFGRIKRQQQIMRGLIAAADGRNLLTEATRLLTGLQDHIRTDMDIDQLVGLASAYQERCTVDGLQMEQIPGEVVYGPLIDPLFNLPLSYVVSEPEVIEEMVARLLDE